MIMFLYEGVLLGVIGSIIGGTLSLIGGYAIGMGLGMTEFFFNFRTILPVFQAVFLGIFLCLICTLYPAYTASKLNPIDAIRRE
jgi:putative ABC transport system permease protein